jgi:hypothetical protein
VIRIERDDPLLVLRELPDGWAQCVITGPPDGVDTDDGYAHASLIAVVGELGRITRPDGTLLWNIERPQPRPLRTLVYAFAMAGGWQLRKSELASRCGYLLFSKQPHIYWQPQRTLPPSHPVSLRAGRRAWCVPGPGSLARQRLERLLLAATSRRACGACGAPRARRARPGLVAPCGHLHAQGRCLVIDPFQMPGSVLAGVAVAHGRSYLGIQTRRVGELSR